MKVTPEARWREIEKLAPKRAEILNSRIQGRDCGPAGQTAPAEDIAKRIGASDMMAVEAVLRELVST